jgi:hypothetical protein
MAHVEHADLAVEKCNTQNGDAAYRPLGFYPVGPSTPGKAFSWKVP